ncbi:MAG TPA: hypothetical protein VJ895_01445 [Candidatus Nanoarchaeia archaeon]|nr:hypothetical protein [Candidatus Nanoarchaeia archaeon]
MKRVKFEKGKQRAFIEFVLKELNCPSLRAFLQFGLDVSYSTLKNYFVEDRILPEKLFREMCYLAKLNSSIIDVEYLDENFGQIKGGKKSRK